MDWYSFVFGIIGTFVGGLVTFIFNILQKKSEKTFQMSVEIRKSVMELYSSLSEIHGSVMKHYYECIKKEPTLAILSFKQLYDKVLEAYKMYRIHLGDLKAYEVNSSIFNYFYDISNLHNNNLDTYNVTQTDFKEAYRALKDCCGLLINEVRFALIEINSLKKLVREDRHKRNSEYLRYSNRLNKSLTGNLSYLIEDYNKKDEIAKKNSQENRLMIRINVFVNEYRTKGGTVNFILPETKEQIES